MALDIWLAARLVPGNGAPRYTGQIAGLGPENDIIWSGIRSHPAAADSRLEVHSDIPLSRGLGSSAAATLASLALCDALDGVQRSTQELFRDAAAREGHPDNAAPCALGGTMLVVNRSGAGPLITPVTPHHSLGVALAVPERTVETRAARQVLPNHVPSADLIAQASRAAALVLGLERGDPELIAAGMDDCYAVPRRADLITGYEQALAAATAAGAFGMTISGSGSTLIALTAKERVTDVASAMAHAVTDAGNAAIAMTPDISKNGLVRSQAR
jgi:homoserine kinase